MDDSHQQWTQTQPGPFEVVVVFMPFGMDRRDQSSAEDDKHERHSKLEPFGQPLRHRNFQDDHSEPDKRKRQRVPEPPEEANGTSTCNSLFSADERCDCDDVVWIRCVLEAKQETDSEHKQN
jgi:hypothetical protein